MTSTCPKWYMTTFGCLQIEIELDNGSNTSF